MQGSSGDPDWSLGDESVLQQLQLGQVAKGVLEGNIAKLDALAVGVLVVELRHKRKAVEKSWAVIANSQKERRRAILASMSTICGHV